MNLGDIAESTYSHAESAEISGLHERREARVPHLYKPRDLAAYAVKAVGMVSVPKKIRSI